MAFDGCCCSFASRDLKMHDEGRAPTQTDKFMLQTSVTGASFGQHTDEAALAEQSCCRPAAVDYTAKQMQHRTQQDATTKASPHNYSKAMPNTRNNTLTKTDLANNGKQDSDTSHNPALDASSDSRDFPDKRDSTQQERDDAHILP